MMSNVIIETAKNKISRPAEWIEIIRAGYLILYPAHLYNKIFIAGWVGGLFYMMGDQKGESQEK